MQICTALWSHMKRLNGECAQRSIMDAVDTQLLPVPCYSVALTMLTPFTHAHIMPHEHTFTSAK